MVKLEDIKLSKVDIETGRRLYTLNGTGPSLWVAVEEASVGFAEGLDMLDQSPNPSKVRMDYYPCRCVPQGENPRESGVVFLIGKIKDEDKEKTHLRAAYQAFLEYDIGGKIR